MIAKKMSVWSLHEEEKKAETSKILKEESYVVDNLRAGGLHSRAF